MGEPSPVRIPWEERAELGLARAFVRTLVMAACHPSRFFALAPRDASAIPALAFGLVFDLVVSTLTFAYEKAVGEADFQATMARFAPELRQVVPNGPELVERVTRVSALVSLLSTPVTFVLENLVTSMMAWVGLRLTKNLHTSFGTLVRVFAYASWVRVFGIIGVTGDVVLSTLSFLLSFGFGSYVWVVAVKQSQAIDVKRAGWASFVGALVAVGVACVIGVPLVAALVAWALSHFELPTPPQS